MIPIVSGSASEPKLDADPPPHGVKLARRNTLLYGGDRLEEMANRFTKRHFDLQVEDLDVLCPCDDTSIDPEQLDQELRRHPRRLLADYLSDDETVAFLLSLGFDLRCERGHPLRSTKAIALQIEAVARGLACKMPDQAAIGVETFEARMAAEAAAFAARKRARPR